VCVCVCVCARAPFPLGCKAHGSDCHPATCVWPLRSLVQTGRLHHMQHHATQTDTRCVCMPAPSLGCRPPGAAVRPAACICVARKGRRERQPHSALAQHTRDTPISCLSASLAGMQTRQCPHPSLVHLGQLGSALTLALAAPCLQLSKSRQC